MSLVIDLIGQLNCHVIGCKTRKSLSVRFDPSIVLVSLLLVKLSFTTFITIVATDNMFNDERCVRFGHNKMRAVKATNIACGNRFCRSRQWAARHNTLPSPLYHGRDMYWKVSSGSLLML